MMIMKIFKKRIEKVRLIGIAQNKVLMEVRLVRDREALCKKIL